MNKYKMYIDDLINNKVPSNSGYKYVATEAISIPIYKVNLGISKRHIVNLELVEEMVLQLISIGINDVDMIAGTLGLPRDILDVTIGDLHVKDLAVHSSGKCLIMAKGREALKNLKVSKREKDTLYDVYVDAITGEIYGEVIKGYTQERVLDDSKMKYVIDANSIDHYRRNMSSIAEIFEKTVKRNIESNMQVQDELISIDSVDDFFVGFVKLSIYIYVSDSGSDIDIIACSKKQKDFLEIHKDIIIEQMRARKILSNLFVSKNNEFKPKNQGECSSDEDQYLLFRTLNSIKDVAEYETQARNLILSPRKLFENELLDFCKLIFSEAQTIDIQIESLSYWSKKSMFLTIGSYVSSKNHCSILYKYPVNNGMRAKNAVHSSCPNIHLDNICVGNHDAWLRIVVDTLIKIDVYCYAVNALFNNQYIHHLVAYIS